MSIVAPATLTEILADGDIGEAKIFCFSLFCIFLLVFFFWSFYSYCCNPSTHDAIFAYIYISIFTGVYIFCIISGFENECGISFYFIWYMALFSGAADCGACFRLE